mgnify:CR=1 FL=1
MSAEKKLTELTLIYDFAGRKFWEERLSLYIRPKPKFLPLFVWKWLVKLICIQTTEVK